MIITQRKLQRSGLYSVSRYIKDVGKESFAKGDLRGTYTQHLLVFTGTRLIRYKYVISSFPRGQARGSGNLEKY
jgi:hypothetical protein